MIEDSSELSHQAWKLRAVQLAGEFPANQKAGIFILRHLEKVLREHVYNDCDSAQQDHIDKNQDG